MTRYVLICFYFVLFCNVFGQQNILGGKDIDIESVPWQVSIQEIGTNDKTGEGGLYVSCDRIIIHPNYNETSFDNELISTFSFV